MRELDRHLVMSVRGPEFCVPETQLSVWIDSAEAAGILEVTVRHVRRIAADLDGQCIAGRWMFLRHNVIDYAEQKRTQQHG
jgi:hypothetical protein